MVSSPPESRTAGSLSNPNPADRPADEEKKRYFKTERTQTAPATATWSSDAVKRRKLEDRSAREAARRSAQLRNHVRRHPFFAEPLRGGLLSRELGGGTERGPWAPREREDVVAKAWAAGLVDKGQVPFVPSFARPRHPNIPSFYVNGDDEKTGMGVAYVSELALRPG
jgi:hypothetical protein